MFLFISLRLSLSLFLSPSLSHVVLSSIYRLVDGFVSIIVTGKSEKRDCRPIFNDRLGSTDTIYRDRASFSRRSSPTCTIKLRLIQPFLYPALYLPDEIPGNTGPSPRIRGYVRFGTLDLSSVRKTRPLRLLNFSGTFGALDILLDPVTTEICWNCERFGLSRIRDTRARADQR